MESMALRLANLAFELNHVVDVGRLDALPMEEVTKHIAAGSIFTYLETTLGRDLDISLFYNDDRAELAREWRSLLESADASRKFGVNNSGLCLLQAYVIEGLQRRLRDGTI